MLHDRTHPYQDVWLNGSLIRTGARECESRYTAIKNQLLNLYKRPFTVLDLGAAEGYFSARIAADFPSSTVVAVDENENLDAVSVLSNNPFIHLNTKLTIEQLKTLSECEHFDVVLCQNVLHHFGLLYAQAFQHIRALGDWLVIETPSPTDTCACGQDVIKDIDEFLNVRCVDVICKCLSHVTSNVYRNTYVLLGVNQNSLYRSYWSVPDGVPFGRVYTVSTFKTKSYNNVRKGEFRDWIPGINLDTYLNLKGQHPPIEHIYTDIEHYPLPHPHGDIAPWNFILTRDEKSNSIVPHLIDYSDPRTNLNDKKQLQATLERLKVS